MLVVFRDYIMSPVFNDMLLISFRTRKVDKRILNFLERPCSNIVGSLLVCHHFEHMKFNVDISRLCT